MPRPDGRELGEIRPISFQRGFTNRAPGSVLAAFGNTKVLCTAMATDGVPPFLQGKGRGWLTAEYSMLPSSTEQRKSRDRFGSPDGRSIEIQRLISRSLRGVMNLSKMTERTIWIDCDVLQADGGTRTAAITGGYVALMDAVESLVRKRALASNPIHGQVAAVSVGICSGAPVLDLDYAEDSSAETDMNVVMNNGGAFIEIQGTAEGHAFRRHELDELLNLAASGVAQLLALQLQVLAE